MEVVQNIEQLFLLDNKSIHNFSLGVLDSYFYLSEKIQKKEVFLFENRILYIKSKSRGKTYVFTWRNEDEALLKKLQIISTIYSINQIPFLTGKSKFKEIAYTLSTVFNPKTYPNAKKRHQRIHYPLTWLVKNNMQVEKITTDNINEVSELHKKWVNYKMNQLSTFRMMFPTGRYLRCCKRCIFNEEIDILQSHEIVLLEKNPLTYKGLIFKIKGELVAIRVFYIEKLLAFDLAFFTNTWDTPSQISNYIDIWCLKELYDKGINILNCGASLNRSLKIFKTHIPSKTIESYMYSKIKGEINENN